MQALVRAYVFVSSLEHSKALRRALDSDGANFNPHPLALGANGVPALNPALGRGFNGVSPPFGTIPSLQYTPFAKGGVQLGDDQPLWGTLFDEGPVVAGGWPGITNPIRPDRGNIRRDRVGMLRMMDTDDVDMVLQDLDVAAPAWTTLTTVGDLTFTEITFVRHTFGDDTTGCRIWEAGYALADIVSKPEAVRGKTVLELGSGTGVGGLSAAAAGAASVLLTDGGETTLDLLKRNAVANGHNIADVAQLRWGDGGDIAEVATRGPFDIIMGSDLLYDPESFPGLLKSLEALCTPGLTEVLLTYPVRRT